MRRFYSDPACILAERFTDPNDIKNRYGSAAVGGNPTVVKSPIGNAMRFDSSNSDYLDLGRNSRVINISNPFTVITYARQISATDNAVPFGIGIGGTKGFMFYQNGATHMNFWVMDYAVDRSLNADPLTLNQWTWLIGISTSTETKIYVNTTAKTVGTKGAGSLVMPSVGTLMVAGYSTGDDATPEYFFNGDVALGMIFAREWSVKEITNLVAGKAF